MAFHHIADQSAQRTLIVQTDWLVSIKNVLIHVLMLAVKMPGVQSLSMCPIAIALKALLEIHLYRAVFQFFMKKVSF